jgi:hypothetical protein
MLVVGVLVLLISGGFGGYLMLTKEPFSTGQPPLTPSPSVTESAFVTPSPTPTVKPTTDPSKLKFAATGPGTYVYAKGKSAVFGTAGTLRKYRVAIETGTPVPIEEFTARVDETLSDERSWIGGKNVRLQRVSDNTHNFTVYLVTPGTAQRICGNGGFDIFWRGEPYTSCRIGGQVLINIARYLRGIPDYGAPLADYQQYAINHEVGHALGHGHELCPKKGALAPVMAQQTFGLYGCLANSWPYLDGKRYAGPPGRIVPSG